MENIQNTLFFNDDVFVMQQSHVDELKRIALLHQFKRSRLCLHGSRNDAVQEMIIVAHRDSKLEAHRHPPLKPESYHVIEGELAVNIFSDNGEIIKQIVLRHDAYPRMYRIQGNIWHQPIPISEWVVYHEVYTGPFDKNLDVVYRDW